MGFNEFRDFTSSKDDGQSNQQILQADGAATIQLPDISYIRDADLSRDGMDLVLNSPDGQITIEGYFSASPTPQLQSPDGLALTPQLVQSFTTSSMKYAGNETMNDQSPVGEVSEVSGEATVTRPDGSVESITLGTSIFQGDIVETDANGAVNIIFIDETSFAISEDARLAIDEYVFDPDTGEGSTDFSMLKGVFVFTSGIIGRTDPDDITIDTPVGSIGVRGTIIAGDITKGEITVIEGAIVLRDLQGHEMTLATQFETARFGGQDGQMEHMGQISAQDVVHKFAGVSNVAPNLFASINDIAKGEQADEQQVAPDGETAPDDSGDQPPAPDGEAMLDGDPALDGNGEPIHAKGPATQGQQPAADAILTMPPPPLLDPTLQNPALGMTEPTNYDGTTDPILSGMLDHNGDGTAAEGMPPPPPDGGNTIGDETLPPPIADTNIAPQSHRSPETGASAPNDTSVNGDNFFAFAQNNAAGTFDNEFKYNFNKEFHDPDGPQIQGDGLHFQLSGFSINKLNDLMTDTVEAPGGFLLNGWSFDNANGQLSLDINDSFDIAANSKTNFNIQIRAIDIDGDRSGWENYAFEAYNPINATPYIGGTRSEIGTVFKIDASTAITINGKNNTIFEQDGAASDVTIQYTNATLTGSDNTLYLGESANNTLTLTGIVTNNTIFGGYVSADSFNINTNASLNTIYGMDGNDTFTTDNTANNNKFYGGHGEDTFNLLTTNNDIFGGEGNDTVKIDLVSAAGSISDGSNFVINGGGQGSDLEFNNDVLEFYGATTVDFSIFTENFKNFETIDMGANSQTLLLSFDEVFTITDQNNKLFVTTSGGTDTLTLDANVAGASPNAVNQWVDINGNNSEDAGERFDLYVQDGVELFVDANIGVTVV